MLPEKISRSSLSKIQEECHSLLFWMVAKGHILKDVGGLFSLNDADIQGFMATIKDFRSFSWLGSNFAYTRW